MPKFRYSKERTRSAFLIMGGLVIFYLLGYATKTLVDFAGALGKDRVELNALKTDSTKKEKFEEFILKFMPDSSFQVSRIKFPLKYIKQNEDDGVDSTLIQKKDWIIISFYSRDKYRTQTYDNFEKQMRDTDKRLVEFFGLDSGVNKEYKFQRINGFWYLTEYKNISN